MTTTREINVTGKVGERIREGRKRATDEVTGQTGHTVSR